MKKNKSTLLPKKQKQGIFLLIGIGLGVILMISILLVKNTKTPLITTLKERAVFEEKTDKAFVQNKDNTKNFYEKSQSKNRSFNFRPFNPNTITKEELIGFGLSEKQASNFVNYTKAGGVFREKQDLKKLYFMNDYIYNLMSPYVIIPQNKPINTPKSTNNFSQSNYSSKSTPIFDLNKADTIDLQALRGIGPFYSKRIYNYGQKLGGYVRIEQLKEVYGMTDSLYESIKPYLIIENPNPRKLNINTFTLKQLSSHPYIDFYLAKAIIKLRYDLKTFTSLEQIRQIHLLDDETYQKLLPYLEL